MGQNILTEIESLEQQIQTEDITKKASAIKKWSGADVLIRSRLYKTTKKWLGDQPTVISLQNTKPRRRVVITEYSRELSWLFYKLRQIFSGRIDYISKYDFYGLLAQSAIDYLEKKKGRIDMKALLFTVLKTSRGFVKK